MQEAFRLDGLAHVRLAARRAGNPFFGLAAVDEFYTRTVFAGRGLLFLARPVSSRSHWHVHLAFFAAVGEGHWLVMLPHHEFHGSLAEAQEAAENLAALMHRLSWHHAAGLFAHPGPARHARRGDGALVVDGAVG
ncbi:hypothetical protein [Streptomyces sp. NPDC055109]